jgi:hypothetical protein
MRIRTSIATHVHSKLATPTRLKVATLRWSAVRREPDIDDARNPNASRRHHPQTGLGRFQEAAIQFCCFSKSKWCEAQYKPSGADGT